MVSKHIFPDTAFPARLAVPHRTMGLEDHYPKDEREPGGSSFFYMLTIFVRAHGLGSARAFEWKMSDVPTEFPGRAHITQAPYLRGTL